VKVLLLAETFYVTRDSWSPDNKLNVFPAQNSRFTSLSTTNLSCFVTCYIFFVFVSFLST